MRQLIRWLSVCVLMLGIFGLGSSGILSSLDRVLTDWRLALAHRPATGDTIVIQIDSKSLAAIGTWPWPRNLYGKLLDTLMDAGADQVAFDIDFSSASSETEDSAFEAALRRAGGYAFLAAFAQNTNRAGELAITKPLERFARQADPVLVNVLLDSEIGRAISVPVMVDDAAGPIEALASRLGRPDHELPSVVTIDYSIDLLDIPRYSFTDVLYGRVDASVFAGKQIIVGASAIELRDFFQVPRYGIIPGPVVQAMALETIKTNRMIMPATGWPIMSLPVALAVLMLLFGRPSVTVAAALTVTGSVATEILAWFLYARFAILVDTSAMHLAFLGLFLLINADEGYNQFLGRRAALRRLTYLATHDANTGLLSRQGLTAPADTRQSETLVVLEMRHIDELRATLGHVVVQSLLAQFAGHIAQLGAKAAALVGQQSFALLYDDQGDAAAASKTARHLVDALSGLYHVDDHLLYVSLLAGYASGPFDREQLLAQAESAILHARQEREEVRGYSPADQKAMERRQQMERDLRLALANGELFLAYQPQIDLKTREVIGAETLVRWTHPVWGPISPAEFIPLAEDTGLIADLGQWVMSRACHDASIWPVPISVAVNVSPIQFEQVDIVATAREALRASGLSAHRLDIEITEGSRVSDPRLVSKVMAELHSLGTSLSVDDFGTGYASLSYLRDLPFDTLKIDQLFIRNRSGSQADNLLGAIVDMARKLGKTVVGEGVEDEATADLLTRMGCDIGQGYHFSRPIPDSELRVMLGEQAERSHA